MGRKVEKVCASRIFCHGMSHCWDECPTSRDHSSGREVHDGDIIRCISEKVDISWNVDSMSAHILQTDIPINQEGTSRCRRDIP